MTIAIRTLRTSAMLLMLASSGCSPDDIDPSAPEDIETSSHPLSRAVRDILWHNDTTGETKIWHIDHTALLLSAESITSGGAVALVGAPWHIVGIGDFNANNKDDIVWHNESTGETQVWYVDGAAVTSTQTVTSGGSVPLVGAPWHIVGIGDFNRDYKSDILWHNESTGETQVWYMNGTAVTSTQSLYWSGGGVALAGAPWHIVAVNDFQNLNPYDDYGPLWYNESTGEAQIWHMNGAAIVATSTVNNGGTPLYIGPPWKIVGALSKTTDPRGILWHNETTGETKIWNLYYGALQSTETVHSSTGAVLVGAPWHIVNH